MPTALILAGGESHRFGGPKAFAEFRGRPMLAWVAAALAPLADETLVAVADSDQEERVRHVLPGATPVRDARPGRGPVEGLARGLETARGEVVLVAPCDAPFLRTSLYELLLVRLEAHDAVVPRIEVPDPLRAVYRRKAALRVLEASRARIPSPIALVDRLDAVLLPAEDLRAADPDLSSFLDVNRAEDLEALETRGDRGPVRDR